ncbi:hypothetical protein DDE83_006686 [Stemphylium lycopersici]|uniref:Uncharacterized protein n=1 Tax=Stemphylium lycopersici TaxID=183478 RepID=A0A364MYL1_STELY|nr:hypothetical protein DDE83_006686 [Stemphylium lycopersici]
MSTHFRPRPPSSAPLSPVRPASARSTIRAITPSPPPSLNEAMRLQYAGSGILSEISSDSRGRLDARPKSDGFKHMQAQGSDGGKANDRTNMTEGSKAGREGGLNRRTSPAKRESQSQGPRKRPYSKPATLPQNSEQPLANLAVDKGEEQGKKHLHSEKVQGGGDSDTHTDCPETPTPMTALQKRYAYLPMGAPISFARSKGPADTRSNPSVANNSAAAKMNNSIDDSSYWRPASKPSHFSIKHPLAEPSHGDLRTYAEARRERLRTAKAAQNVEKAQPSPLTETGQNPQQIGQGPAYADRSWQLEARLRVPEIWERRAYDNHTHLSPPQAAYDQNAPLRGSSPSTANPTRHASISAVSTVSGGTANSKRSVFSTLGRDEMERKKALVEKDQGPFSRAVSMADLKETRRKIGAGIQGDEDGGTDARKRKDKGRRKGLYRFGCSCLAM